MTASTASTCCCIRRCGWFWKLFHKPFHKGWLLLLQPPRLRHRRAVRPRLRNNNPAQPPSRVHAVFHGLNEGGFAPLSHQPRSPLFVVESP